MRPRRALRTVLVGSVIAMAVATAATRAASPAEADGALPHGVSVFDHDSPAVANLGADLRRAVGEATMAAADDGIEVHVTSGWRSEAYQGRLRSEAVERYGSEAEAARWVAPATTSAHVHGDAVDIGHTDAAIWMSDHGAPYGICRIYDNEPWHFELRPEAATDGCPPRYADATQDPRTAPDR